MLSLKLSFTKVGATPPPRKREAFFPGLPKKGPMKKKLKYF
jgi:hypothetical protein